jgi:hypothetical protein
VLSNPTRLCAITLTAGLLALAPVNAATSADTTVGATFATDFECGDFTALQIESPSGDSYTVPSHGVITSYTVEVAAGTTPTIAFKLARKLATDPTKYEIVASSDTTSPTPGETSMTRKVRMPTKADDVIGTYGSAGHHCLKFVSDNTYRYIGQAGNTGVGPFTPNGSDEDQRSIVWNVSAVVEPDADSDGYGDTTQDLCPTDATTHQACATPTPKSQPTCDGVAATITGTPGDDELRGTNGPDVIAAGRGKDRVLGFDGDDLICGGRGNDQIRAGYGDDRVLGKSGNDLLFGFRDDDTMRGGVGDDLLRGGGGDDQLHGGPGNDLVVGHSGQDQCTARAKDEVICD